MKHTDVEEEHHRLACEIANLQNRKAILTAPIGRPGTVMEPTQEELLARQRDSNGMTDPLAHANIIADHARVQLREAGTSSGSPRSGGGAADIDGEDESEEEAENGAAEPQSSASAAMLLTMCAGGNGASNGANSSAGSPLHELPAPGGASANHGASPTPPTIPGTYERTMPPRPAGGWSARDRLSSAAGGALAADAPSDPLRRIVQSNRLQPTAHVAADVAPPFAGLSPMLGGCCPVPMQPQPYAGGGAHAYAGGTFSPLINSSGAVANGMLPSCSPPLGGGSGASGVLQPSAQHAQQAARLQQLMHSHMNLQMLARMQQGGGVAAALQSNASLALLPAMGPASCYASPLASPLGSPQLGSPQLGGGAMSPLMACMAAASPEQQEMMMMHLRMQQQHPLPHLQQHPHQPQQQPCIQPMRMLQQPMHVPPPQPPPHPQPQPQPHRHPMPARSTKRSPPPPLRAVATPVAAPPASLVPTIIVGAPAFGSEDAGVIAAASAPPHAVGVTPHAEPASALAAPAVPAESAAVEPGNDRGGASGVQRAPAQLTLPTQGDG